jgi:hypothetical protein
MALVRSTIYCSSVSGLFEIVGRGEVEDGIVRNLAEHARLVLSGPVGMVKPALEIQKSPN